jgi:asparagine synthase (glutamine-hydrolysing)
MCGIAGLLGEGWDGADFNRLFGSIAHRGPDGAGTVRIGDLQLGMNRLRFRGAPVPLPVTTPQGVAAYNGQVYGLLDAAGHYQALADGLENEVSALSRAGFETDGMYACATVANGDSALRLSTDTHFIKPMYYHAHAGRVAFCSEAGPLLRLTAPNALDHEALADLFAYGWYLDSGTFAANLYGAWDHDLELVSNRLRAIDKRPLKAEAISGDAATELRHAIAGSVQHCLQGAGPFGLALSGGLDSSILAWELNKAGIENLVTISVRGMEDGDGIDRLEQLGLPAGGAWETWTHHIAHIDGPADFLRRFEASIRSFAQPSTMSSLPLYHCLADAAAEAGVRVLLTGEGVDELFCGYASYAKVASLPSPLAYYEHAQRDRLLRLLFGDDAAEASHGRFAKKYGHQRDIRWIEREIRLTRLLVRSDACLMARSIEGRVPFLHNRIPEMALSLPWQELAAGQGKCILREAYRHDLGALATTRKTRFKASDAILLRCLEEAHLRERMLAALTPVFGRDVIRDCLRIIVTDDGFDADILCLLMSLTFLIEEGWIDAHAR